MEPFGPRDAMALTIVFVVFLTLVLPAFYFLMIRPVSKQVGQGRLFPARGMGLRLGGCGFKEWPVRSFAAFLAIWAIALSLLVARLGYLWFFGAVSWPVLLHGLSVGDHVSLCPREFRRSVSWMAMAHVPCTLALWGGWADWMGWASFPFWAFQGLVIVSIFGFTYVALLPIRKTPAKKRSAPGATRPM